MSRRKKTQLDRDAAAAREAGLTYGQAGAAVGCGGKAGDQGRGCQLARLMS